MTKRIPQNERMKRDYVFFLEQTKGLDHSSTDKVLAAIRKFEVSTGGQPFAKFRVEQAARFKRDLNQARNARTGKPLSHSTVDATLALVREFFTWLAGQPGFRSKFTYSDAAYFRNNRKDARIAHTQREARYPSVEAAYHAFQSDAAGDRTPAPRQGPLCVLHADRRARGCRGLTSAQTHRPLSRQRLPGRPRGEHQKRQDHRHDVLPCSQRLPCMLHVVGDISS